MGCKSNQLEGALIEENLTKNGYKKAENISDADIFILNSCTVTHKSDNEALHIIKKAKNDNKNVKTMQVFLSFRRKRFPSTQLLNGRDKRYF